MIRPPHEFMLGEAATKCQGKAVCPTDHLRFLPAVDFFTLQLTIGSGGGVSFPPAARRIWDRLGGPPAGIRPAPRRLPRVAGLQVPAACRTRPGARSRSAWAVR